MLSRRQIQKFGALCDEDLGFLERQVDLILAIRRHHSTVSAKHLHLVQPLAANEDMRAWLTREALKLAKSRPVKAEHRARTASRRAVPRG